MKSCAITGHTKGIGKALASLLEDNQYSVLGFSRSNGYNLCQNIEQIAEQSKDTDIFVNNAFFKNYQVDMFKKIFSLWQHDKTKTIVNINSRAQYDDNIGREYSDVKKTLANIAKCGNMYDRECRIINISPGYVATSRVPESYLKKHGAPYISAEQCAEYIKWAIDQPIEIGELSLWKLDHSAEA